MTMPSGLNSPTINQFDFRTLGSLQNVNFNSTADQFIPFVVNGRMSIEFVIIVYKSGTPAAAVGGVYSGAVKTGTQYVPAAQAYTVLTGATTAIQITPAFAIVTSPAGIFLSLTTPAGAAATCDVYVQGSLYDS
jgi:hypothetical protein